MKPLPAIVIVALLLPAGARGQASEAFEQPADAPASAALTAQELAGEGYKIQDPVHGDGLMRHYFLESRFGNFEAYGAAEARIRMQEIAALVAIEKTSATDVVFDSVTRGIKQDVNSAVKIVTHPVGTVLGIPKGIGHLLGKLRAQGDELKTQTHAVVKGEDGKKDNVGQRAEKQAVRAGERYADNYIGLSAAQRRWYAHFHVDPYTDNKVLRHAIEQLAKIDAAASLGMRFAPVGIPFAGEVNRALDTIYNEDPAVLRKRRHEQLIAFGLSAEEATTFERAQFLSPTRQTLLVNAATSLNGVEGRAELLRHAMTVTTEVEEEVFMHSVELMLQATRQQPLIRILPGLRVPSGQWADGRVGVFGALDAVYWTQDVAGYEKAAREALPADAPARELWASGTVSDVARSRAEKLGWRVHDHAIADPHP